MKSGSLRAGTGRVSVTEASRRGWLCVPGRLLYQAPLLKDVQRMPRLAAIDLLGAFLPLLRRGSLLGLELAGLLDLLVGIDPCSRRNFDSLGYQVPRLSVDWDDGSPSSRWSPALAKQSRRCSAGCRHSEGHWMSRESDVSRFRQADTPNNGQPPPYHLLAEFWRKDIVTCSRFRT